MSSIIGSEQASALAGLFAGIGSAVREHEFPIAPGNISLGLRQTRISMADPFGRFDWVHPDVTGIRLGFPAPITFFTSSNVKPAAIVAGDAPADVEIGR